MKIRNQFQMNPDLTSFFVNKQSHSILASSNSNCFIHLLVSSCNKTYSFLVDSGAPLSAVTYKHAIEFSIPLHKENVIINGLGGQVQTIGYVYVPLSINGYVFNYKFFVFNSLPVSSNGILGRDFLNRFGACLDFEKNILSLNLGLTQTIYLPLTNNNINVLEIPPRCESIHYIQTEFQSDCIICSQELQDGVYLASSVATPKMERYL